MTQTRQVQGIFNQKDTKNPINGKISSIRPGSSAVGDHYKEPKEAGCLINENKIWVVWVKLLMVVASLKSVEALSAGPPLPIMHFEPQSIETGIVSHNFRLTPICTIKRYRHFYSLQFNI